MKPETLKILKDLLASEDLIEIKKGMADVLSYAVLDSVDYCSINGESYAYDQIVDDLFDDFKSMVEETDKDL
jgi:hypothetical protein